MQPKIIYESDEIIISDKPSGWITNKASTTGDTPVLQDWISKNLDFGISKREELRSGIVHRLDKETSGIIIVAKTRNAFRNLQAQFKERQVKKTYIALVHGKLEPEKGSVNAPVGRLPWNRERFGVFPGGRKAMTEYKVVSYHKGNKKTYSLVEVYPKTGRTHQIRVHMKYLDHPVVSDTFYAGRKTSREDRKMCPRLFLHAHKINFAHPESGESVNFQSDLPKDLKKVIKLLEAV